ncbi:hypothetical protein B0H67DRAFT_648692 [Lasiosphaeris hirsuta]|uniref:LTD domain-containing protein n=1 Tax=Lasiosphaeris hirsuta TaxID=260670 RepID=A0AA40A3M4_9PEZI|nr:hypothetical protein B0H67DRAFT_648692 [Lasiosphaeris hirsuta]
MPVKDYGVWKALPVRYTFETNQDDRSISPHLSLFFADGEGGEGRAAVNIKSGDRQGSRLAAWILPQGCDKFRHPIVRGLASLKNGFHPLAGTAEQRSRGGLALDFIRDNLFQRSQGRILPHDVPRANNDILDALKPLLDEAIATQATVYIYGSHFDDGKGGKGIHNIHQNQGNPTRFAEDDGVYQDGGILIQFDGYWAAIFIAFASQAIHTDDRPAHAGHPRPRDNYRTWADFLLPEGDKEAQAEIDLADTSVVIRVAVIHSVGQSTPWGGGPAPLAAEVKLLNRTTAEVDLTGWSIRSRTGHVFELKPGLRIPVGKARMISVPGVYLSKEGGTITLFNNWERKVHGVAYYNEDYDSGAAKVPFSSVLSFS